MGRRFRRGDIDSTYNALRPRMGTIGSVAVVTTTIGPHTHSADQIGFTPAGNLAGDDVQEVLEELDSEKLARDGSQTMLGNLDMNHFSINNIDDAEVEGTATVREDLVFTGAAGLAKIANTREVTFEASATTEAQINNVRQIHLIGDDDDGEAKIDGAERITFNNEPTKSVIENPSRIELNTGVEAGVDYTAAEGKTSWDTLEDTLVLYVASGASVVALAFAWGVFMATNGESPPV